MRDERQEDAASFTLRHKYRQAARDEVTRRKGTMSRETELMKKIALLSFLVLGILTLASCASLPSPEPTETPTSLPSPEPVLTPTPLEIQWELYPDPEKDIVTKDEEIVFRLIAQEGESLNDITIHFGDGTKQRCVQDEKQESVCFASHMYRADNLYTAYAENLGGVISNTVSVSIPSRYYSDRELKEQAIQNMTVKIKNGIDSFMERREGNQKKIAFSSFKDANFEYLDDQKDVNLIQKIIQRFVRDPQSRYIVLERTPQALVRLGYESVVRIKEKNGKEEITAKLDNLEYGLTTKYNSPEEPFVYGIKMEGINDKRTIIENFIQHELDREKEYREQEASAPGNKASIKREGVRSDLIDKIGQAVKQRPLLYAQFDTADYLIVINRIYDSYIKKSEPNYYSLKYKMPMVKRTASVKANVRVLDRKGEIVWIQDVIGDSPGRDATSFPVESATVIPHFVPASEPPEPEPSQDKMVQEDAIQPVQADATQPEQAGVPQMLKAEVGKMAKEELSKIVQKGTESILKGLIPK